MQDNLRARLGGFKQKENNPYDEPFIRRTTQRAGGIANVKYRPTFRCDS